MSKLALGTVQFGLNYGIANQSGQIEFSDAANILQLAKEAKIDLIDTAIAYGNSEKILGKIGVTDFNLISKLPSVPKNCQNIDNWVTGMIQGSLERLKIRSLYGLMIHQSQNLLDNSGKKLVDALYRIKSIGLVKKIGVSIYNPSEIDDVINLMKIDIVQAPLNVIDRRLETSGWLSKLHEANIEVHTRSTFLQGLLLLTRNKIPAKFDRWANIWDRWCLELKKNNLDAVQVCLSYPLSLSEVDRIVIGVDNVAQLKNIIKISQLIKSQQNWSFMISNDQMLINPSSWSSL